MLINIDQLRLSLGGRTILDGVRLSLDAGEIYGLLGPNGAGKSTTIAVALGLLNRFAGRVRVFGRDPRVAAHQSYHRLGVLPEQNGFYDWMSGEEYLAFFAALQQCRLSLNQIRKRLAAVGLEQPPGQTVGTYSRGMRQRLGVARALIADPELLILDEPTNGLDPRGRREIHDILLDLAERGIGVLLCTHLLDDVDRLCRRVGVIVEGRTVVEGAIAELMTSENRPLRFRLRLAGQPPAAPGENEPGENQPGAIENVSVVAHDGEWWVVDLSPATMPDAAWRELLFRGWPIAEIRREAGGLEDLYLTLTERKAA